MARIAGVNIPRKKRIEYALTYVKGIGLPSSRVILTHLNISPDVRTENLTEQQIADIQKEVTANYLTEDHVTRQVRDNIQRLTAIGCYRGLRHKRKLPARGQRTRTNARTRKGPRKAGSQITLKKKVAK